MDVWVLSPDITRQVHWCPWFPVDHAPVPPGVLNALTAAYQPIAYSKFGVNELQKAGVTTAMYVPHGVDTKVFRPRPRAKARALLGGCPPDDFLVGIVAANKGNPSRKAFDQQIRAFATFNRRHPKSMLYIHTDFDGVVMGVPLAPIIEQAGIPPECIGKPDGHRYMRGMLGDDYMAAVYNACDVVMNATKGEGFGIPILEAQASGTPVIVTDFSSMPELCFAGWKVPYVDKDWTYQQSYQVTPSVADLVDALEEAYSLSKSRRVEMRQQARAGAMAYDADVVTEEYWKPALLAIEARIAGEKQATEAPKSETVAVPTLQAVAA
jgi:glycosyltransferase involved in cell wall biosynthesis